MIKQLRHTGIVVNNLDKCLSFYLSLGFNKVSKKIEKLEENWRNIKWYKGL